MALIDTVISAIGTYRDDAVTALESLASFRPTGYDPAALAAPTLDTAAEVAAANLGAAPRVGTVDIARLAALPALRTTLDSSDGAKYAPLDRSSMPQYQHPALDNSLGATFLSDVSALRPAMFDALQATVLTILSTGGGNVSAGVQSAIFDQGHERSMQIAKDALDLTGARTGAKGCRYPNSMTKAYQKEIALNYLWQRNDLSREIVKQMADLAEHNLQTAMQSGTGLDEARVRVFTEFKSAYTDAFRATVERYRADVQANMQQFETGLQLQIADLGVQRAEREEQKAVIASKVEQLDVEGRLTLAGYDAMVKAELSRVDSNRAIFESQSRADLSAYDAENRAEFLRVETDRMIRELGNSKNEQAVRLFSAQVQQDVEIQRSAISQAQEQNRLAVGILENVAKTYVEMMNSLSGQGVAVDITKH